MIQKTFGTFLCVPNIQCVCLSISVVIILLVLQQNYLLNWRPNEAENQLVIKQIQCGNITRSFELKLGFKCDTPLVWKSTCGLIELADTEMMLEQII